MEVTYREGTTDMLSGQRLDCRQDYFFRFQCLQCLQIRHF